MTQRARTGEMEDAGRRRWRERSGTAASGSGGRMRSPGASDWLRRSQKTSEAVCHGRWVAGQSGALVQGGRESERALAMEPAGGLAFLLVSLRARATQARGARRSTFIVGAPGLPHVRRTVGQEARARGKGCTRPALKQRPGF